MIITKTPFRVSFCGGGTDFPDFYKKYSGQVLSTTIDKYMYILVKKQTGIIEHKYKIHWNKTEFQNHISQINHPIVKRTLHLNIKFFVRNPTAATRASKNQYSINKR